MKNLPTSPSGRKWQRYNRWRSAHRELDRQRRLEKLTARKAAYVAGYVVPKLPVMRKKAAWATVRIRFASGESAGFSIHELPEKLSVSPTMAGHKVRTLLSAERKRSTKVITRLH